MSSQGQAGGCTSLFPCFLGTKRDRTSIGIQSVEVQIPALPLTKYKTNASLSLSLLLLKKEITPPRRLLWSSQPRNLVFTQAGDMILARVVSTDNILRNTAFIPNFLMLKGRNWAPSRIKCLTKRASVILKTTWVAWGLGWSQTAEGGVPGRGKQKGCSDYSRVFIDFTYHSTY